MCESIWKVLSLQYIPKKSCKDWLDIAEIFESKWGFPHCIETLDGKHIRITKPPGSGSASFNYKKYFSFILMATCDARYRFTWIDVGNYGSLNDSSVFGATGFGQELESGRYPLPDPKLLLGTEEILPYFFIGDEAFKLRKYLMRPYTKCQAENLAKDHFNYRLSRARMTIEDAFGILTGRLKILHKALYFNIETSIIIVKCLVCLHNFIISQEMNLPEENKMHASESFIKKNCDDNVTEIDDNEEEEDQNLCPAEIKIRDILTTYFQKFDK